MQTLWAVDIWVSDFPSVFDTLEKGLGIPVVPPEGKMVIPGFGIFFAFAPVSSSTSSRLCVTALNEADWPKLPDARCEGYPFVPEIMASQGDRPIKTHATEVVANNFDEIHDRLRSRSARFRLDPPDAQLSIPRIWTGFAGGEEAVYDPATDGGLRLEILPLQILEDTGRGITESSPSESGIDSASSHSPTAGDELTSWESRAFLVNDLKETLQALKVNIGWEAARTWTANGGHFAELTFDDPSSASLQIVSPADPDSDFMGHLKKWGPGPYTTRLVTNDLTSRAEALRSVGIDAIQRPASDGSGRQSLRFGPESGLGGLFEIVQA